MPGKDDLDNLQTQVVRGGHRQNTDQEATRLVRPNDPVPGQPVRVAAAPLDAIPDTRRPAMAPLNAVPGSSPVVSDAVITAAQLNAGPAMAPKPAAQPAGPAMMAPGVTPAPAMPPQAMAPAPAAPAPAAPSAMAPEPMMAPPTPKPMMTDPEATRLVADTPPAMTGEPMSAGGRMSDPAMAPPSPAPMTGGMHEAPMPGAAMHDKPVTMAEKPAADDPMGHGKQDEPAMHHEPMAEPAMMADKPMTEPAMAHDEPMMQEVPMMHDKPMGEPMMSPEKAMPEEAATDQPMLVASEAKPQEPGGTMIAAEPPTRSDPAGAPMEAGAMAPAAPKPLEPPRERPNFVEGSATRIVGLGGGFQPEPARAAHGFDPVVGWVVVVEGPGRGSARTVHSGMNALGRDRANRIPLDFGDQSISRDQHAFIAYDERENTYFFNHGGKKNPVRLNGQLVIGATPLTDGAKIEIGATTLKFVALCGPDFNWGGKP